MRSCIYLDLLLYYKRHHDLVFNVLMTINISIESLSNSMGSTIISANCNAGVGG